jgi:hypothetical protein
MWPLKFTVFVSAVSIKLQMLLYFIFALILRRGRFLFEHTYGSVQIRSVYAYKMNAICRLIF